MKAQYFLFAAVLFSLGACGGGGSSDSSSAGGSGGSSSPQPSVVITAGNAEEVAAKSVTAQSVTTITEQLVPQGTERSGLRSITLSDLTRQIFRINIGQGIRSLYFDGLCLDGSIDAPPEDATSGTITFIDCELVSGFILDGQLIFSTTTNGTYTEILVTYSNIAFSYNGSTNSIINASLLVGFDIADDIYIVSGPEYVISWDTGYVRLYDFSMTEDYDDSLNYTWDYSYTVDSSLIGGVVRVTTSPVEGGEPYQFFAGESYPRSGTIIIIAANGRIKVVIDGDGTSGGTVTTSIDADNDGIYETVLPGITFVEFDLAGNFQIN